MEHALTPRALVESFYDDVWNAAGEDLARAILHPAFRFRGSLGAELEGPEAFIGYMRSVHMALGHYTCTIDDLVESEDRVATRMTFKGIHRGVFFGAQPDGREIKWAGGAFFHVTGGLITKLWVLGDVDGIKRQLSRETHSNLAPGFHGPAVST